MEATIYTLEEAQKDLAIAIDNLKNGEISSARKYYLLDITAKIAACCAMAKTATEQPEQQASAA